MKRSSLLDKASDLSVSRRNLLSGGFAVLATSILSRPVTAQDTKSVRIGGTLALTGPLAQTALTHKIAGDIFVERQNASGGLLGRKVEWVLYDDQSKPEVARTLYEKLITDDKVDFLIGPYATGAILSAMTVAERTKKPSYMIHSGYRNSRSTPGNFPFMLWVMNPRRPAQTH